MASLAMLDDMLEGAAIVDRAWRFRYLNGAAAEQLRRSREAVLGRPVSEIIPGFEQTAIYRLMSPSMEEARPSRFEASLEFPDGRIGWYEFNVRPVPDGLLVMTLEVTERHEAVERLSASEERFRAAFDSARDPMAVLELLKEPDGSLAGLVLRHANRAWMEAMGEPMSIEPGDRIDPGMPGLGALVCLAEQTLLSSSSSTETLDVHGRLFEAAVDRFPNGLIVTLHDITRQVRRERELAASEERYRSVVAELDAVVTMVDVASGGVLFVAGQTEAIFGCSSSELEVPGFWRSLVVPEDHAAVTAARAHADGKARLELDYRIRRPDGSVAWLNERARSVQDEHGTTLRWYAVTTDISARRRSEAEAAASRAALEAVLEHSPLHNMIVRLVRDEAGQIEDWEIRAVNRAALRVLGIDEAEIVGRRATELWGDSSRAMIDLSRAVVASGRPDTRDVVLPGNGRTYQTTSFSFGDDLYGLLALDVTTSPQARAATEQLARMAALGELAARIAHDFKNLLFGVDLHLGVLDPDGPRDLLQADIESIRQAVALGVALAHQLLDFARPRPPTTVVDLGRALAEVRPVLTRLAGDAITLEVSAPSVPLRVYMDGVRLQQVFLDLVMNARDAIRGSGRIEVVVDRVNIMPDEALRLGVLPGRYARVRIGDSGTGIAPEILPRIFEPYFTTKSKDGGTGLGLATAYAAIHAAGGAIEAGNRPEGGAVITVHLPLEPTAVSPDDTDEVPEDPSDIGMH